MDAFPDYTKFKPTKKVLAMLQIITEDVDSAEDTRHICTGVTATDPTVKVVFDPESTDENTIMTASGANVDGSGNYDANLFGTVAGNATQLTLGLNIEDGKEYTVVQNNPALDYFSGDANVTGTTKTKDYVSADLMEGYALLLSDKPGNITVTVTDKESGDTVQNVTITNNVTFKAASGRSYAKKSVSGISIDD